VFGFGQDRFKRAELVYRPFPPLLLLDGSIAMVLFQEMFGLFVLRSVLIKGDEVLELIKYQIVVLGSVLMLHGRHHPGV